MRVAGSMDVVNARIPAPAAGAATARVEVTLAIVFTSNGHAIPRIIIPVAAGSSLSVGPPHPDLILLTGPRRQLRIGQAVAISLVFALAGHATLQVPVIEPTP